MPQSILRHPLLCNKLAEGDSDRVLASEHLIIEALLCQKGQVRPLLDDLSVEDDQDQISIHDRGKPVRDDEAGAAAYQVVHRLLEQQFRAGVYIGDSLVKDQQRPVGQQQGRKGDFAPVGF